MAAAGVGEEARGGGMEEGVARTSGRPAGVKRRARARGKGGFLRGPKPSRQSGGAAHGDQPERQEQRETRGRR